MAFPKSHAEPLHRLGKFCKIIFLCLSCLDNKKNQENQAEKPYPMVPGGGTAQRTTRPASGVAQTVPLGIPAIRSAPDPFAVMLLCRFYLYQQRSPFPAFRHHGEYPTVVQSYSE
jgi:hypothetical protein